MKVLVVGAGAVGQVYGWHLKRGGVDLTFYVKEKYRAEVEAGLTVYPLNEGQKTARQGVRGFPCRDICERGRGKHF